MSAAQHSAPILVGVVRPRDGEQSMVSATKPDYRPRCSVCAGVIHDDEDMWTYGRVEWGVLGVAHSACMRLEQPTREQREPRRVRAATTTRR